MQNEKEREKQIRRMIRDAKCRNMMKITAITLIVDGKQKQWICDLTMSTEALEEKAIEWLMDGYSVELGLSYRQVNGRIYL